MPTYSLAFWNVENLFDIKNSPRRTDKLERTLRGELKGWTQSVLDRKISQLASIITQINGGSGPDLLGVCEVENRHVLELLRDALDSLNRSYEIIHADTQDARGIDVAFIYDEELFTANQTFFHFIVKRYATRELVQVNFETAQGKTLVVVGNHWPSRSGGELESEPYRIIAGETLAYFHQRILEELGEDTPILAMGDFNDEPFNRSLTEFALAERQRRKVTQARSPKFLNLMWPFVGAGVGTHYYSNYANVLDQFLANASLVTGREGLQILPESAEILRFPEMVSSGYPDPIRFDRGDDLNRDGFSDHYPIAVEMEED